MASQPFFLGPASRSGWLYRTAVSQTPTLLTKLLSSENNEAIHGPSVLWGQKTSVLSWNLQIREPFNVCLKLLYPATKRTETLSRLGEKNRRKGKQKLLFVYLILQTKHQSSINHGQEYVLFKQRTRWLAVGLWTVFEWSGGKSQGVTPLRALSCSKWINLMDNGSVSVTSCDG